MIKMMVQFFKDFWKYRKQLPKEDVWIRKFAEKNNLAVNPGPMFYTNLKLWIIESKSIFGKRYCPCFEPGEDAEVNKKLICPCEYLYQEIEETGTCHCKLFGSKDLTKSQWKEGMGDLVCEYRIPLNMKDDKLDTRGYEKDHLRGLMIPDALHQVKQALGQIKGKVLQVIVSTKTEAENLEKLAEFKGIECTAQEKEGVFEVSLKKNR